MVLVLSGFKPKGENVAFSIKRLVPVPIKRAVKKLLGMEKPKPAKTFAASKSPVAAKPVKTGPIAAGSGTGAKGKGSAKRRSGTGNTGTARKN